MMEESTEIAARWAKALAGSPDISAWCQREQGKAPIVMLGYAMEDRPGESMAPYVLVFPAFDQGGFEEKIANSSVLVALGIIKEGAEERDAVRVQLGVPLLDELKRLVRNVIAETEYPPSRWESQTSQPGPGYFEHHCKYEIDQPRTI